MIYPWQASAWQQVLTMHASHHLPHAMMLIGRDGIGKTAFAEHLMQFLLCAKRTHCGTCHACELLKAGTHQNVLVIEPEKEGSAIKVDQIRELNDFVAQSSLQGGYRFALIKSANQMNASAANALLKTLEEPSEGAIIILLCDQIGRLPATIASRCHKMQFAVPAHALAKQFLQQALADPAQIDLLLALSHGAPLAALKLVETDAITNRKNWLDGLFSVLDGKTTPLTLASAFQTSEPLFLIDHLMSLIQDVLRLQLNQEAVITHADYRQTLMMLIPVPAHLHLRLFNRLTHVRKQWLQGVHLNKQLMLESLIIDWFSQQKAAA